MTDAQRKAGLAVMRGTFYHRDVRRALQRAGVPIDDLKDATDSLLREQREAGNIRYQRLDDKPITEDDSWVKL